MEVSVLSPLTHHMRHKRVPRHRPLTLALAAALTTCTMVVGVAAAEAKPAGAGPGPPSGNKEAAKACQKGNWDNYVTSTGEDFASEEECTSYAAQGGTLVPASTVAPCLNGGWQNYVTSTGESFASEQACRSYAAQGGTLAPKPPPEEPTPTLYEQWEEACESYTPPGHPNEHTELNRWVCDWVRSEFGGQGLPAPGTDFSALEAICEEAGGTFSAYPSDPSGTGHAFYTDCEDLG